MRFMLAAMRTAWSSDSRTQGPRMSRKGSLRIANADARTDRGDEFIARMIMEEAEKADPLVRGGIVHHDEPDFGGGERLRDAILVDPLNPVRAVVEIEGRAVP